MMENGIVVRSREAGPEDGVVARAGGLGNEELSLGVVAVPPWDHHTQDQRQM